jgi:hypothetical protein
VLGSGNVLNSLLIVTVVKDHPNQQFIRVCGDTTAAVPEFNILSNLQSLSIADFVLRINTLKDL